MNMIFVIYFAFISVKFKLWPMSDDVEVQSSLIRAIDMIVKGLNVLRDPIKFIGWVGE